MNDAATVTATMGMSPASTLAEIEARLKARAEGPSDVLKLPVVLHKATGLHFRVGPMKRTDHEAWHNLRFLEDDRYRQSGGAEKGAPLMRDRSDVFLMGHAVWTEDGQRLPESLIRMMLDGEGYGPSTYQLLEAATYENPPRSELVREFAKLWGATSTNLIMSRILREAGLLQLLRDRLVGDETEKQFAMRELAKWEEALEFWEAEYECAEIAKRTGVGSYARLAQKGSTSRMSGPEEAQGNDGGERNKENPPNPS